MGEGVSYEPARGDVDLKSPKAQDFTMQPTMNFVGQLPGDELLAALPEATAEDVRMKTVVRKNCTGCHTAA